VQAVVQQEVIGLHHVVVTIVRKFQMQAVARFARLSVADPVRQDDVVARDIERLALAEKFAGELRTQESAAVAARAVHDEDGVVHVAGGVAGWRAEGGVVQAQVRELLARLEFEVMDNEIALLIGELRLVLRLRPARAGEQ